MLSWMKRRKSRMIEDDGMTIDHTLTCCNDTLFSSKIAESYLFFGISAFSIVRNTRDYYRIF